MSAPNDKPRFARNINSGRPFRRAVWKYREKGWTGTLALPPREKHPPPIGYTGRGKPYPDNDTITAWLDGDISWKTNPRSEFQNADVTKANIGLHLGPIESTEICACGCKKCLNDPEHYHCKSSGGEATGLPGSVAGACLWGQKLEIIGLDVDDYLEGTGKTAKRKRGGLQLRALEKELGPLPPTWRSSAREGISGIRFFLVPAGLAFRGKAADNIDVIQAVHRFAVVFPSYHPSGGQYVWYRPADPASSLAEEAELGVCVDSLADLPDVTDLAVLPAEPGTDRGGSSAESWLDFLTRGRTRDEGVPMDMDTDAKEIVLWAKKRFVKATKEEFPARFVAEKAPAVSGDAGELDRKRSTGDFSGHGLCARMVKAVAKHKVDIADDPSSHDKITKAHWNLLRNAMEGHTGWEPAVREIERYIIDDVRKRNKRGLSEVRSELYRSKTNALRKIKGEVDAAAGLTPAGEFDASLLGDGVDGVDLVSASCSCFDDDSAGPKGGLSIKKRIDASATAAVLKSPGEYDTNDDGNAAHFIDLHMTADGPSVRFIADLSRKGTWMVWNEARARWCVDDEAGGLIRRRWWLVKDRQVTYVEHLKRKLDAQINLAVSAGSALSGMNAPTDLVKARAEYQKWAGWAEKSGNNMQAEAALKAAASIRCKDGDGHDVVDGWRVTCTTEDLNGSKHLLGVANGVIDLGKDPGDDEKWPDLTLRDALPTDLITMNTEVAWPHGTAERAGSANVGRVNRGSKLWRNFLDKFLPDPEIRRIAQIAMGSTLYGGNPQRALLIFIGASSTGKSTFSEVCAKALGNYGGNIGKEAFQGHKFKPTLILNKHKRFVINSEFDANVGLSTAMIKEITGNDGIPIERKGVDEVDLVYPHFTPGLATNTMPRLTDPDTAVERRIYPIRFDQVIDEDDPDLQPDFADKLKAHALDAVFEWLVDGYTMYRRDGGLVRNELTEWWRSEAMTEIDDVSLFISQCFIVADNMKDKRARWQDQPRWCVSIAEMRQSYETWFYENDFQGFNILSKPAFVARMSHLGYWQDQRRVDGIKGRFWFGVQSRGRVSQRGSAPPKLKLIRKTKKSTEK